MVGVGVWFVFGVVVGVCCGVVLFVFGFVFWCGYDGVVGVDGVGCCVIGGGDYCGLVGLGCWFVCGWLDYLVCWLLL